MHSQAPNIRLDSSLPSESGQRWQQPLGQADRMLRCNNAGDVSLCNSDGSVMERFSDPLAGLAWMEADAHTAAEPCRWVGYLSYDLGRLFERLPERATNTPALPWYVFTRHRLSKTWAALPAPAASESVSPALASNFSRAGYTAAVQRAIDYIGDGDIFQVNLSQRFTVKTREPAASLYTRIQQRFPAWYAALLEYGDHALVCNSPELFFAIQPLRDGGRRIVTRPIKGTRPRQHAMDAELLASPKDQAELNMIVDLERNDLGRVCCVGSVKVTEPRTIETHPTVYHGAATVEGRLRDDVRFTDLLRAIFPGGSITGAPKIRAMEIIEELEPARRGPYCGAIGYLDADGTAQFNIAIRTLILHDGCVDVPVGGGIVADSSPQAEYEETLVKAQAALAVLGVDDQLGVLR